MKYQNSLLSLCVGLFLVGCDSRIDAVNMQMAEIRNQPPLPIEPAPDFHLCRLLIMLRTN
jgi:type IV pilus assembly protein PilP